MAIDSEENWSISFSGNFYTAQSGSYAGRIEPIAIPATFKSLCRVYASSFGVPRHWRFAGRLTQVGGGMDVSNGSLTLNKTCIFKPPLLSSLLNEYSLRIEPPKWLKHLHLEIDQYQGEYPLDILLKEIWHNSGNNAEIQLKQVEIDLKKIKIDLS